MNRSVRTSATTLILLFATSASAQPGAGTAPEAALLRGDSTQTRKRLAEAEQKLLGNTAGEAVEELQRVLDEAPDDLIMLDARRYRSARWVIHSLLAKLPADALRAYQDRIDQPARKLLEQGKRDRDARPLWLLLDRYFVSRPAEESLVLLGEFLFERGEFRAAEEQWRRLLPDAGADLSYPASKVDQALTRARIALAVIYQNDPLRAAAEVAAFKARYPDAAGSLAGRSGPLSGTLAAVLTARPRLPADASSGTAWPTFGGGPDRAGRVPGGIPAAWPSRPTWPETVPTDIGLPRPPGPGSLHVRQPLGHPVIVNGEVFVTDGVRLYGYDLRTGAGTGREKIPLIRSGDPHPDTQCTLTASGGLLYARVGPAVVRPAVTGEGKHESQILCLHPKPRELGIRWRLTPPEDDKTPSAWEGAPLVAERRLWAVYAKFESGRVIHVLACYDPADAEKAPDRPLWMTEVSDGQVPGGERVRHELLTLAGRHIVFCSNTGAIVAVDAATGRRAWGFRYPRARRVAPGACNDPAPPVAFAGCVYVAPADGEAVYALDAETGKLVWESGLTEGARILGVARNRLVIAVAGPLRGVRGLDLATGSHRSADGGWVQDSYGILSHGQGFVTDDVILWPTRAGLYFLDPETGRPGHRRGTPNALPNPVPGGFGHVAYADGVLVVVTSSVVCGLRAQSPRIDPPAPPLERFDAVIARAERELAAGRSDQAIASLADCAGSGFPTPLRAWAVARTLQLVPKTSDPIRLPAAVRGLLSPDILHEWLVPPDRVPVTLESYLQIVLGKESSVRSIPSITPPSPPCPPGLGAEAEIDHTLKLPAGMAPLNRIPGAGPEKRFFASGATTVTAIPIDQTATSEHTAADLFTHAAELPNGFVAAGPFAVAVYGPARAPLWVFRMPTTDPLPVGSPAFRFCTGSEPACPQLSSFYQAGTWLFARVGDYHLIALDLTAQRVAWVLDTAARSGYDPNLFPGAPRFGVHLTGMGSFLLAQLSDGRRWFIDVRSGRPVPFPPLGSATARNPWPHPPIAIGTDRLLVSDGPGLVRLLHLGGRVRWAFEVDREEGLTGAPAQVWARNETILVALQRNHGVELERVDPANGKLVWSGEPPFIDADRLDLARADADGDRVYLPVGNRIVAIALTRGKTVWEVDLPDARGTSGWTVRAGKTCVIAYPVEAIPAESPSAARDRLARSFIREPLLWRLPGLSATLYDNWVGRSVPVLLFDLKTGERVAQFEIPARGPSVTAHFGADATVIATGDRVVWLK
jgi:outer membrane protein assembly factor BamB